LRGPEPDPERKLIVVWGDSVVFGIFGDTWINLLDRVLEGRQVLNGGLEGDLCDNVVARAQRMNKRLRIDCNVLMPGWHPMRIFETTDGKVLTTGNDGVEEWLADAARSLRGCILCTAPTALNERVLDEGFQAAAESPCAYGPFQFWNEQKMTRVVGRRIYDSICERNDIVRRVAVREGSPLLDWAALMDSSSLADFREDFFDPCHPRLQAYPKIARIWEAGLRNILQIPEKASTDA
jgi:hypothetical protein